MKTGLPSVVAAFFEAHNTGRTEGFDELFTADAIVSDEEHEHRGKAIKSWIDEAVAKYKPVAKVTNMEDSGDQLIVIAQVSGNFPGSPTSLRYKFVLCNGKIAALDIGV